MKRRQTNRNRYIFLGLLPLLFLGQLVVAQEECETGFCPPFVSVHHREGEVATHTIDYSYSVVKVIQNTDTTCWIAQNLGTGSIASSSTNSTAGPRGWFFQYNRKRAYYYNDASDNNIDEWNTNVIDENSDWLQENDPCFLLLGSNWRIPTYTEYSSFDSYFGLTSYSSAWSSSINLHAAGYLREADGLLVSNGSVGYFWTSSYVDNTTARAYYISSSYAEPREITKMRGCSVRCVRNYR